MGLDGCVGTFIFTPGTPTCCGDPLNPSISTSPRYAPQNRKSPFWCGEFVVANFTSLRTLKPEEPLNGHQCVLTLTSSLKRLWASSTQSNTSVPFRSQQSSRRDLFEEHEQHLLTDLPTPPWQHTEWKRAKVAPDFHITVAAVRYSVPRQLVGRTVDAYHRPAVDPL